MAGSLSSMALSSAILATGGRMSTAEESSEGSESRSSSGSRERFIFAVRVRGLVGWLITLDADIPPSCPREASFQNIAWNRMKTLSNTVGAVSVLV